jgi:arsenical pump membrane protein
VNILTIDATHVALGGYLRVLLLPAVLVALTTVAAIALLLRGRLDPLRAATPRATMSPLVRPATLVLAGVAGAYVAATALRVPVGPVAAAGAVALAAVVGRGSPARLRRLRADVSWSVLLVVAGLFVVVQGLEDTGVTAAVLHWWLDGVAGSRAGPVAAFAGAAVGSNLKPIGSLATLLWLVLLRSRGIRISATTYIRYGVLVTVPALIAGAAGLLVTAC